MGWAFVEPTGMTLFGPRLAYFLNEFAFVKNSPARGKTPARPTPTWVSRELPALVLFKGDESGVYCADGKSRLAISPRLVSRQTRQWLAAERDLLLVCLIVLCEGPMLPFLSFLISSEAKTAACRRTR